MTALAVEPRTPSWHSDSSLVGGEFEKWEDVREHLELDWDLEARPRGDEGAERWVDIVRTDTNEVIHPAATRSFALVTMNDFGRYIESAVGHGAIWDTFHVFHNGAEFCATIKLNEEMRIKGDDSIMYPFIGFSNRVDGKGALNAFFAMNRLACFNMVTGQIVNAKQNDSLIRFFHSSRFDMDKAIEQTSFMINREREFAQGFVDTASRMNNKQINVKLFLDKWLPISTEMTERQERNVELKRGDFMSSLKGDYAVKRDDTAWAVLQAAVESYQYKFPVKGTSREKRGFNMMRLDANIKKAYTLVMDMSGERVL